MSKFKLLLAALLCGTLAFSQSKGKSTTKYADGKDLIKAMYNKYAPDKWYRYFTFSQGVEFYRNDSMVKTEVWHEAYAPGKLIIKVKEKNSKNGRLYNNYTSYSFQEGQDVKKNPRVHELLLVGLDVYFIDPEKTIRLLDSLGYDLSKIREDEFDGRKVYVVGAEKGDEKSRQFWIDAERLYMHRIVYAQKGVTNDVVFGGYKKMEGNWIACLISFKADGKLALTERYYDIKFPKTLNEDWFNPEKFNEVVLD